jgi:hypothetical protein
MSIHVRPKTGSKVPRWVVADDTGCWDKFNEQWVPEGVATLYPSAESAAEDARILALGDVTKKNHMRLSVLTISIETYSDMPVDPEVLRQWLFEKLSVSMDVSKGYPTDDSIVVADLRFDKYKDIPLET